MKKSGKKFASTLLTFSLVGCACAGMTVSAADAAGDTQVIEIGTSGYTLTIPASYAEGERTSEEISDDLIAYYKSDDSLMDFDLYQFDKQGKTLEEYANEECEAYNGTDLAISDVNGIPYATYMSVETYADDPTEYAVGNVLVEADTDFVEICFWLDGDTALVEAGLILSTLSTADGTGLAASDAQVIEIGTSGYTISIPASYSEGERTSDEISDDLIAYYKSDDSLMDFDLYQFDKQGKTLEEYANEECEAYNGSDLVISDINGIPYAAYMSVETYGDDPTEYTVGNVLLETDTDFVEISFWLDGETALVEAGMILASLSAAQ